MASINNKQNEYFDTLFEKLDCSKKILASKTFESCRFVDCNFTEVSFEGSKFCDCEFSKCDLSLIKVNDCKFYNTTFDDSKVTGVNWTEAAWPRIKLICQISFIQSDISHSTFFGINLQEIKILRCRVQNADFREANLCKANLSYSDFKDSMFIHSDLTESDFTYADNYKIDLTLNKITGAKFMLPEAISLLYGLDIELIDAGK